MRKNITLKPELGKNRKYMEMYGLVWLKEKLYVHEVREKNVYVIDESNKV